MVAKGRSAYTNHKHKEALELLGKAISEIESPPERLSQLKKLREQLLTALVISSQAQTRLGNDREALALIARLDRAFPETEIPFDDFGPESVELRKKFRNNRQERAKLKLKAVPGGELYIFGRSVGRDDVTLELSPGGYKVFAASGDVVSPVHSVNLKAGKTEELSVQLEAREVLAKRIAKRAGVSEVALLGASKPGTIEGRLFDPKGDLLGSATVKVGASKKERAAFIRALTTKDSSVAKILSPDKPAPIEQPSRWSTSNKIVQTAAFGLGLGILAAWGVAALDTEKGDTFKLRHNNVMLGAGTTGVVLGAAFRWAIVF